MALGGNTNSGPLFILKPVERDSNKNKVPPHFSITEKVNGKWSLSDRQVTRVTGELFDVRIKEQEYKDEKYNTVSLFLKDGEETYLLDLRFNLPSRSLFNSIASLERFDDLAITVYQNKSGYMAFGLWQGKEMVKWKYSLQDLPTPEAVMFKGKEMHDYTSVDNFFVEVLKEISGKLGQKTKDSQPANQEPDGGQPDGSDEDVPF